MSINHSNPVKILMIFRMGCSWSSKRFFWVHFLKTENRRLKRSTPTDWVTQIIYQTQMECWVSKLAKEWWMFWTKKGLFVILDSSLGLSISETKPFHRYFMRSTLKSLSLGEHSELLRTQRKTGWLIARLLRCCDQRRFGSWLNFRQDSKLYRIERDSDKMKISVLFGQSPVQMAMLKSGRQLFQFRLGKHEPKVAFEKSL